MCLCDVVFLVFISIFRFDSFDWDREAFFQGATITYAVFVHLCLLGNVYKPASTCIMDAGTWNTQKCEMFCELITYIMHSFALLFWRDSFIFVAFLPFPNFSRFLFVWLFVSSLDCLCTYTHYMYRVPVYVHSTWMGQYAFYCRISTCMTTRMQFPKFTSPCECSCLLEIFFTHKMPTIFCYLWFPLHSFKSQPLSDSLRCFWHSTSGHVYTVFDVNFLKHAKMLREGGIKIYCIFFGATSKNKVHILSYDFDVSKPTGKHFCPKNFNACINAEYYSSHKSPMFVWKLTILYGLWWGWLLHICWRIITL